MAVIEIEDRFSSKCLQKMAIIQKDNIYAKSRYTFLCNKGIYYLSYPLILPKKSSSNRAVLHHIHDNQGKFKVENNSANVPTQTKMIRNEYFKY